MTWAMSNDYAAVLTTINAAVLLVGTVQYTGLMRRVGDRVFTTKRQQTEAKRQLIEQQRGGIDPSAEALLQLRNERRELRKRTLPNLVASLVWSATCLLMITNQMQVLAWLGTAQPGAAATLARRSFLVTLIGVSVLVAEPLARGTYRLWRGLWKGSRGYRTQYTRHERRRLQRQIRTAVLSPPEPATAPTPPRPDTQPAPSPMTDQVADQHQA